MDSIDVLYLSPVFSYLEQELDKRFNVLKLWTAPNKTQFIKDNSTSIRAIVGHGGVGADAELIESLPKLEIISSFSVGMDKVDLKKCKEKGVRVTNTPDVLTDDVADIAIGLALAVMRRLCESDRYVRSGLWKKGDYKLTTKFTGKTVGIIGLGRIGKAIAKRAEAFSCPIAYFSRTKKPELKYKYYPTVVELASKCDVLVVACALTEETRHIINHEVIDAMGPKGVLINIGRGHHVDEPELVSALLEGRLGGAGLDVYQNEPEVPEQLFGLENVVLLPHAGSGTTETRCAMADIVIANLEAHFLNKPLLTPVSHSPNFLEEPNPKNNPNPLRIPPTMESIGVLLPIPMSPYLEQELQKRFNLFKLWTVPDKTQFIKDNATSIRALIGNASAGADAELIDSLPKLEIVASYSVGIDKVDLKYCKEKRVRVTNTPDVLTDDVADIAIGLTLAVMRRLCESDRYVRSGLWKKGDYKLTTKFTGKTVGIIGLGRIGKAIAKRAEAFSCPIAYFSRTEKADLKYKYYPTVVELASHCDVLVVACPLAEETLHIINREVIDALGPKGVLINIGRGPHVDEPELVSALLEGRLGGAGLDVYQNEPNVPDQLFGLENVVLLPHVGSATTETRNAMADLVIGNLEAHFLNKPLLTPVV
ncbi:hypothetical protein ACLB2K_066705 [Fragaria x ananassa]